MCSTWWGRCFPVPRAGLGLAGCSPGSGDTSVPSGTAARRELRPERGISLEPAGKGRVYREMINSLFADLLQELEGAEKVDCRVVGWFFFFVKAVKLLCHAVMVNEVRPAV